MQSPLVRFIAERTIAGVKIGMSRENVTGALGKPGWWEGHLPKPVDESDVWRYGNLQIAFAEGHVCAIAMLFETLDEVAANPRPADLSGTEVDSTTTLDDFVGFLQRNKIMFNQESDITRKPILRMPEGVVARFSRRTDHERSVAEGRPIISEHPYLVSIRIGENQLVASED